MVMIYNTDKEDLILDPQFETVTSLELWEKMSMSVNAKGKDVNMSLNIPSDE